MQIFRGPSAQGNGRVRTQNRTQLQVVLLVAMVLLSALGATIWKTHTLLIEDQTSVVVDSAMKQIAPLKRLVSEKLETVKNDLVRFASLREAQGPGHAAAFGSFDAVALVEPTNSQWAPSWIEKSAGVRPEKWPQGYDLTLLKSLPYSRVREGNSLWVRLSDAQGAPLFAVLNSVEIQAPTAAPVVAPPMAGALPALAAPAAPAPIARVAPAQTRQAILVGFVSENPLASVTEDYIGSANAAYIVDDHGYVASHVKKNFVGSFFGQDAITKDIVRTQKISNTRQVRDLDGQAVFAHFERIDHSNLTAVIAIPAAAATSLASQQLSTILTFGGGVGLIGLVLAWIFAGSIAQPASAAPILTRSRDDDDDVFTQTPIATIGAASASARARGLPGLDFVSAQSDTEARLLDERKNAFQALSAGLAARLREPLLAILGHAQLTKTKSQDPEVLAHADSIEREARLAKEAIERFQIIEESAALRTHETATCDLEKAVLAALAEKAIEIEGSGIQLEQKLMHVPRVRGKASEIESAVVHLLDNALEALRDRPEKHLTVQLSWLGDEVRFLLKDSGIGMTRDVQSRAFEPFYKGFQSPRHMGLGLSFVHTTLTRIGADAEIQSAPGEGTMFAIDFPVEPDARREFEAQTAAPDLQRINEMIHTFRG